MAGSSHQRLINSCCAARACYAAVLRIEEGRVTAPRLRARHVIRFGRRLPAARDDRS